MDIATWNERLTLLANVGVVIGLGLLIFELKHSSDLAEVAALQVRAEQMSARNREIALTPDLAELYEKFLGDGWEHAAANFDELSPVEKRRLRHFERTLVLESTVHYELYQRGLIGKAEVDVMLSAVKAILPLWQKIGVSTREYSEAFLRDVATAPLDPSLTRVWSGLDPIEGETD